MREKEKGRKGKTEAEETERNASKRITPTTKAKVSTFAMEKELYAQISCVWIVW